MTCATCKHASPAYLPGWLKCAFEGKWESRSPHFGCAFDPSRWQAKLSNSPERA